MAIHSHILHNGEIREGAGAELRVGQLGLLAGWGVFTTLRVSGGVPFAWERHWSRMVRDAKVLHVPMPSGPEAMMRDLLRLIEANRQKACTLRLAVVRNGGGMWEDAVSQATPADVIAMTADSKAWSSSVALGIQYFARFAGNEFAGAKSLSWAQNLVWAERAQQSGFDEVVLLNQHGRVAECTSANIFAVRGHEVFTPPLSEGCLSGITREVLLELAGDGPFRVREQTLTPDDLYNADEVFITSTTRDLLPVREIAGRVTGTAPAARQNLLARFHAFLRADIERRRARVTVC